MYINIYIYTHIDTHILYIYTTSMFHFSKNVFIYLSSVYQFVFLHTVYV